MTQPANATETDAGRFYKIPGHAGEQFISVTNAIGVIHKPALVPWSSKLAGERAVQNEAQWHAIQQEEYERLLNRKRSPLTAKAASDKADEKARKWISAASREYTSYKATLGSAVHLACEHFEDDEPTDALLSFAEKMSEYKGTTSQAIDLIHRHVEQYAKAIDDNGIKILDTERTVFDTMFGYAGTLDAVVEVDGCQHVLDIKTGGVYPESVALQLAAYRYAEGAVYGDESRSRDTSDISGGIVLQLHPKSYKLFHVTCDKEVFGSFVSVLNVWTWKNIKSLKAMEG